MYLFSINNCKYNENLDIAAYIYTIIPIIKTTIETAYTIFIQVKYITKETSSQVSKSKDPKALAKRRAFGSFMLALIIL